MNNSTVDSKYGLQDVNYSSNLLNSAAESLLVVGITMPKALFFENVLITRKPSVEVEKLQKVIPQQLRSGKNCNF